ncbi:hypothetical protein CVT25_009235 [Psilocybe cyanescens]|uniref:Uncharacterized protein n=1 Tax=Psilocybe cyanescens TaxID=93625 RepID=A0A409XTR4_PSICY|nr:hypothetical protein CVT25_009235 [Psilocybe cyanescens]
MARFEFAYFLAITLAMLFRVYNADAGKSVQSGQSSNATCNIDRLQTVVGLDNSASLIQKAIKDSSSNDTAAVSQLKAAANGIQSAQAGVDTILQALVTGQAPPANARQQVGDGIDAAGAALISAFGNSTTSALSADIADAQSAVAGTLAAGIRVVSDCT